MALKLKCWLCSLVLAVSLAGCASHASRKASKDRAAIAAACPAKAVAATKATRAFLTSLTPGRTPARALSKGPKPIKSIALIRPHEPTLQVYFYYAAVPNCPWFAADNPNVPVIVETTKHGLVLGYGRETLQTLQAQGWMLAEREDRWLGRDAYHPTAWPWQAWDYRYLPR